MVRNVSLKRCFWHKKYHFKQRMPESLNLSVPEKKKISSGESGTQQLKY
jgi:hypothetical protein